jgi:GxxExxY protein
MNGTKMILHKELSYQIIGAVYNTRKIYGPGQKEIVYQRGLAEELKENNIPYKREVNINIVSPKSGRILSNYRVDFVIKERVILELKSLKFLPQKMEQQLYSYLRSTPYEVGYLINMGGPEIDIKRVIFTNDRKPYLHLFRVR